MKNITLPSLLFFTLIFCAVAPLQAYKKFVILIASYNNEKWAEKNIVSAFQNYPENNYRIIFIDDCSTDRTLNVVAKTVKKHKKEHLVTMIHNVKRQGAMYNHWYVINNYIADDEIVIILDGDDLLAGDGVLKFLDDIYTKNDVWLTYGQFKHIYNKDTGFNREMPERIVKNNSFRAWIHVPSHLRTFYAKLYKNIKMEDLMLDGQFFEMCADMATMIPMIEQARDHFKFISKILYFYNDNNPISDHKKSVALQQKIDKYVRTLPIYQPLEKLF